MCQVFTDAAQLREADSYYWVSYGLVSFCARFRYHATQRITRGQRVLLRSHRGLELGQVLWPEDTSDLFPNPSESATGWSISGSIICPISEGHPWLVEHQQALAGFLAWLQTRLIEAGSSGLVCDLEYIREPDQLGVLYMGLDAALLARLSLDFETQFHLQAEWYDAAELLAADQAWEERCQAWQQKNTSTPDPPQGEGCPRSSARTTGLVEKQANQTQLVPNGSSCSLVSSTNRQSPTSCCTHCPVRNWLNKQARYRPETSRFVAM